MISSSPLAMAAFEYLEPTSTDECIEMLTHYGPAASLLAGGTDLIVKLQHRALRPRVVVNMGRLSDLRYLEQNDDGSVAIGALTPLCDIERTNCLANGLDAIRQGATEVSCVQIRNTGTIGGNSCNASPSADTVPPLIAVGAEARLLGPKGERRVPLERFFRGPGKTMLEPGELLHGFHVPPPPHGTSSAYIKYAIRGPFDLAIVGIAARVTLDAERRIAAADIVMGAVGPTPIRAQKAEQLLVGETANEKVIGEAAALAASESSPISDQRATAEYRRRMVEVSTRAALRAAIWGSRKPSVTATIVRNSSPPSALLPR